MLIFKEQEAHLGKPVQDESARCQKFTAQPRKTATTEKRRRLAFPSCLLKDEVKSVNPTRFSTGKATLSSFPNSVAACLSREGPFAF